MVSNDDERLNVLRLLIAVFLNQLNKVCVCDDVTSFKYN